jgi:hypothetical protein
MKSQKLLTFSYQLFPPLQKDGNNNFFHSIWIGGLEEKQSCIETSWVDECLFSSINLHNKQHFVQNV